MLIQHKLFESRSTLYNLKPIGINTDEIESLTSYVTRLSTAHNVTLGVLFNELIYPILRKESRPRDGVTAKRSAAYNNFHQSAIELTTALHNLTHIKNLELLTAIGFNNFFSSNEIRGQKFWCPICYEETKEERRIIYDKLIWSFNNLEICPKHNCRLVSYCPNCNSIQYHFHRIGELGYCYDCGTWLGITSFRELEKLSDDYILWQDWVAKNIGKLIQLNIQERQNWNNKINISDYTWEYILKIQKQSQKTKMEIGNISNIPSSLFNVWQRKKHKPSLYSLLKLGFITNNTLFQFFSESCDISTQLKPLPNFIYKSDLRKSARKYDIEQLRNKLNKIINENRSNPPSLNQVAKELGFKKTETLRKKLPKETKIIVDQYKKYLEDNNAAMRNEIKDTVIKLHEQGVYPSQTLIENQLGKPSLFWKKSYRNTLIDIFIELKIERQKGPTHS
ncbi:TniQ family protein [Metabacillus litoralis]|uniref:TniQ family protein n=1 Tax=Metabacillus litoralis TaxID=152268 RepID=UPI001CFDEF56|nr:TniQ family protein [Metabacillus litoralis]